MVDFRLSSIKKCVDCHGELTLQDHSFVCQDCARRYTEVDGVWDFREASPRATEPAIFKTEEFTRWRKVFEEQELKQWYVYSNAIFRYFSQASHRIAAKDLSRDKSTLEIGSGSGAILNFLPATKYVGVDIAFDGLVELKHRFPEAVAVCASSHSLPFADESFEQLICLHTLEHLYFIAESLEEISRAMGTNSVLHYGIPTEGGLGFWLGRKFLTGPHVRRKYQLDIDHIMDREHINDARRVLKFLKMNFEEVEQNFWPLKPLKFLSPNALIHGKAFSPNRISRSN